MCGYHRKVEANLSKKTRQLMEGMGQKEDGGREWQKMLNAQYKHV